MINHVRTLLFNQRSNGGEFGEELGGEYIPPEFLPLPLPARLRTLHQVLFGAFPDWFHRNYRMQQYVGLLHATELVQFVTAFDPRISYNPRREAFSDPNVYNLRASRTDVRFVGELNPPDVIGNSIRRFRVDVTSETTADIFRLTAPTESSLMTFSIPWTPTAVAPPKPGFLSTQFLDPAFMKGPSAEGSPGSRSQLIELPGEPIMFSFPVTPGDSFTVEGYARPQITLGEIAAQLTLAQSTFQAEIFPPSAPEPTPTFKRLWLEHPELPHRLGGLLLAFALRLEALRTQHG